MHRTNRRQFVGIVAATIPVGLAGCAATGEPNVTAEEKGSPPWVTLENVAADPDGDYVSVVGDLTFSPDNEDWAGEFRFRTFSYNEHDEVIDQTSSRRSQTLEIDPGESKSFDARTSVSADEVHRIELEVWDANSFRDCDYCGYPR